ncbi:MAG: CNNM domain-containing protein, partial [Clostridiales bacterium]|nr:CNNM domain-containing protein [Clostridiales bacterium]
MIVLLILFFLSAFFSSAETALKTANRMRLQALSDAGDTRALTVLRPV